MRLTIIGCSGSYPGPDSPASCYLLEADDADGRTWRVLLDLGNGALGALHQYVDPLAIDAVLLSHLHADHCLDLCGYYVMRKYHPTGPQPRIPVWGPAGTADRMARAYDLPTGPRHARTSSTSGTWAGPVEIGPFAVTPVPVAHPVDAFGLRVTADGAHARLHRRHRADAGARRAGPRRRPVPGRGVVPLAATPTRRTCT